MYRACLFICAFGAAEAIAAGQERANLVAINGRGVRIEVRIGKGEIQERYLAPLRDGAWTEIAKGVGRSIGAVSLERPGGVWVEVSAATAGVVEGDLVETLTANEGQVTRTLSIVERGVVKVTTRFQPAAGSGGSFQVYRDSVGPRCRLGCRRWFWREHEEQLSRF